MQGSRRSGSCCSSWGLDGLAAAAAVAAAAGGLDGLAAVAAVSKIKPVFRTDSQLEPRAQCNACTEQAPRTEYALNHFVLQICSLILVNLGICCTQNHGVNLLIFRLKIC